MPERKSVLITFGSPSDVNAVPDFERKDDTEYFLSVGSAHRTPDIVKCHAISRKWDAVVAGGDLQPVIQKLKEKLRPRQRELA